MQDLPTVFVTEKGARRAKAGHPWVFESDIARLKGEPENGGLCTVLSPKERFLGTGFYNENSKIRVRLVSDNANDVCDTQFWRRRVRWALDYRKTVMGKDFPACRLIHGEADRFPGLTVDLFSDTLVVECLSLGTDRILDEILAALVEFLPDYGVRVGTVFERDEGELRIREGMEKRTGFRLSLAEHADGHTEIAENGIRYDVDFMNGQKTGFFLDQKYNRLAAAGIAKGRRVLDCFTHTGAFALNCLAGGAEHVTAVDISASAVEQARKNAALNGFPEGEGKGEIFFCRADVFEALTDLVNDRSRREYDYIILDPPAFTKSSSTVKEAFRGYKDINYRAMRALPRGGYLASASCSHFMTRELFEKMLDEAAADAGVTLRQIESRAAAPDHPHLRTVPETDYLKFVLMQVV